MRRYIATPDKKELYDLYVNKRWSTRKCADYFDMSQPWIRKFMEEYGIPRRSVKENGGWAKGKHFTLEHRIKLSESKFINNGMSGLRWEKSPNYTTGKRSYRKYLTRGFLASICSHCNTTEKLIVHHIDANRDNNKLDNLMVLCASCHKKWHLEHPSPKTLQKMITIVSNST